MIYSKWSLLSSTVIIWGGVASLGLAQVFLFHGKVSFLFCEKNPLLNSYFCSSFFIDWICLIMLDALIYLWFIGS
ncbi:hypothetical protein KSP40_PGU004508 [Platanthera guangdongensis]|uniref:Uncharacterized protein n=1 Tax=Platanthera guangdongensis TaxID=2320717 RepID=A0ABR2ML60_9ASPA